jgi:hypothetical protein
MKDAGADDEFRGVRGGEKGHRGCRWVGGDRGKCAHMTTHDNKKSET